MTSETILESLIKPKLNNIVKKLHEQWAVPDLHITECCTDMFEIMEYACEAQRFITDKLAVELFNTVMKIIQTFVDTVLDSFDYLSTVLPTSPYVILNLLATMTNYFDWLDSFELQLQTVGLRISLGNCISTALLNFCLSEDTTLDVNAAGEEFRTRALLDTNTNFDCGSNFGSEAWLQDLLKKYDASFQPDSSTFFMLCHMCSMLPDPQICQVECPIPPKLHTNGIANPLFKHQPQMPLTLPQSRKHSTKENKNL